MFLNRELKMIRKGLILSGGNGTRLFPLTKVFSKQLVAIYDKPMIYYSLSALMLAGIRDVAVIVSPNQLKYYKELLDDGSKFGIRISYLIQEKPEGLAQAYIIAEDFLDEKPSALILGDNLFYGVGFGKLVSGCSKENNINRIFAHRVQDPRAYGVVRFDEDGNALEVIEKPPNPPSQYAITGLYLLDENAPKHAKKVLKSERGELDITSLLEIYVKNKMLKAEILGRGYAWFDTGTQDDLLDAANFVRSVQKRQGLLIGAPEEIAYRQGWINESLFEMNLNDQKKSEYGKFLLNMLTEERNQIRALD